MISYTVRENSVGSFYAVRSKWFESTHRNKICEYTIIHYLIFFYWDCDITRESHVTYVFFMSTDTVREDSISTLCRVRLHAQGQDFVLVDS